MKARIKSWVTSSFGIALLLLSITLFVIDKLGKADFSLWEMIAVALLGYVFLMAKDSILEGLAMGLFKLKSKE